MYPSLYSSEGRRVRRDISIREINFVLRKELFPLAAEHSTRRAVDNHLLGHCANPPFACLQGTALTTATSPTR